MKAMNITLRIVDNPADLERCFEIRRKVFVDEQAVPIELEMDELDAVATHFLAVDDSGQPVGTARLVDKHGAAKIGRVAVLKDLRGQSFGRTIMEAVVDEARRRGFSEAVLSSQTYAIPFYELLGFVPEGPIYDDAGIPHRTMRMSL